MENNLIKLSIILPVYNESKILEKEIKEIIDQIEKEIPGLIQNLEILIIENGSTDNTLEIAKNLSSQYNFIKVFHLEKPSYGQALKTGLLLARGEFLLIFNIHFHDVDFLKRALKEIEKPEVDIVVGSKTIKGSLDKRPLSRRLITKFFNIFLRIYFHYPGTDTHGVKIFKREKIIPLVKKCVAEKELFDTELLLRANFHHLKIKEIPVKVERTGRRGIFKRIIPTVKDLIALKKIIKS